MNRPIEFLSGNHLENGNLEDREIGGRITLKIYVREKGCEERWMGQAQVCPVAESGVSGVKIGLHHQR
jgi:hypothetical protein